MNILIDENIVFAEEAFSSFGKAKLVDGRSLTNDVVRDAEILIVRSITKVNEELLKNSNVKFVGTATIGTDHIDLEYLKSRDITFVDAKGSNADSVAEYVFTALFKVASEKNISLKGKSIGVIGVGYIGSRIVRLSESLGMIILKNDPPLERKGIRNNYLSLHDALQADIITFHVPMSYEGIDKTFHLLNENNLKKIKSGTIIINTSRGAVIDNIALLSESLKKDFELILDVWENEPSVNSDLLTKTKIATPHIAGYSFEGKVNGTKMIQEALRNFLNSKSSWKPNLPKIENKKIKFPDGKTDEQRLYKLFSTVYNIEKDDESIRKILNYKTAEQPAYFDLQRKKYPVRREFSNYTVIISENERRFKSLLENFRFSVKIV